MKNSFFARLMHDSSLIKDDVTLVATYQSLIIHLMRNHKRNVFACLVIMICLSATTLLPIMLNRFVLDHLHEYQRTFIAPIIVSATLVLIAIAMLLYIKNLLINRLSITLTSQMLFGLFKHYLDLPMQFTKDMTSSDFTQRFMEYESATLVSIRKTLAMVFSIGSAIILLMYMSYCDIQLAIFSLMICLIFLLIRLIILFSGMPDISCQMMFQSQLATLLNEIMLQIHKIRSANRESFAFSRWFNNIIQEKMCAEKVMQREVKIGILQVLYLPCLMLLIYAVIYFSTSVLNTNLLLQLLICIGQLAMILDQICMDMGALFHCVPAFRRLDRIINQNINTENIPYMKLDNPSTIRFTRVSYHDSVVQNILLHDIDLEIKSNKITALIGASGSGKSTLLRLLTGSILPVSGEILINENNIKNLDQNHLRRQFGIVLQSSHLFPGTIFSNISCHQQITHERAWELARYVGLDADIEAMPMKMNTYVSDNSAESLSGGQVQKILIARALSADPKILLLDEATSALDNASQDKIYRYLKSIGTTCLVIAHRLGTIKYADQIYVLEKGRIVSSGIYEEIAASGFI